jgi:hypothetical protein
MVFRFLVQGSDRDHRTQRKAMCTAMAISRPHQNMIRTKAMNEPKPSSESWEKNFHNLQLSNLVVFNGRAFNR